MEHRRTDCCYCGGDGAAVFVSYKRRSTILTTSQTIGALSHALILVAEDEAIIAMDVAMAIRDAGGQVAGPAASVKQALALINTMPVAGAILDVNLSDGDISPVAEILLAAGIPIIIQTGVGLPTELIARYPDLAVQIKPCASEALVSQLALLIVARQTTFPNSP